ncbi:kinase-like domain-containing protein [Spinellus fusiger]|nr:kinase-like domain-containing protein [Spinellus fusiger]
MDHPPKHSPPNPTTAVIDTTEEKDVEATVKRQGDLLEKESKKTVKASHPLVISTHPPPTTATTTETTTATTTATTSPLRKMPEPPLFPPRKERNTLQEELQGIMNRVKSLGYYYKLVDMIGEGTFSSVYKAIDIRHSYYNNEGWDTLLLNHSLSGRTHTNEPTLEMQKKNMSKFVALKRVYSSSSPRRIANEIKILMELRGSQCISPLITAFRQQEEVFVVMPYIQHDDFKRIYCSIAMEDIKCYMRCMFIALKSLHARKILHRDIKPHNFLYNVRNKTGYLIDFGLAQREEETHSFRPPSAVKAPGTTTRVLLSSLKTRRDTRPCGYLLNDHRRAVNANRAGTKGFRAPEVLMRVVHQTTAIDIWSVGVILLSIISASYPFFTANDEADSLVELAVVFGLKKVQDCAAAYNRTFETNIPHNQLKGCSLQSVCATLNPQKIKSWNPQDVVHVLDLVGRCLELNSSERITAEEALQHEFFK